MPLAWISSAAIHASVYQATLVRTAKQTWMNVNHHHANTRDCVLIRYVAKNGAVHAEHYCDLSSPPGLRWLLDGLDLNQVSKNEDTIVSGEQTFWILKAMTFTLGKILRNLTNLHSKTRKNWHDDDVSGLISLPKQCCWLHFSCWLNCESLCDFSDTPSPIQRPLDHNLVEYVHKWEDSTLTHAYGHRHLKGSCRVVRLYELADEKTVCMAFVCKKWVCALSFLAP